MGILVLMNRKTSTPMVTTNREMVISPQLGKYRCAAGSCQLKATMEMLNRLTMMPSTVSPAAQRITVRFLSRTPTAYRKDGRATKPSISTRYHAPKPVGQVVPVVVVGQADELDGEVPEQHEGSGLAETQDQAVVVVQVLLVHQVVHGLVGEGAPRR